MADNKEEKTLTLDDLGLEENPIPTPAEEAAKEEAEKNKIEVVETQKTIKNIKDQPQITSITTHSIVEGPVKDAEKPKRKILVPGKNAPNSGEKKLKPIADVDKYLGVTPKPKKDPIRENLDSLYDLADQGIERTKKDLLRPGGRIEEAKIKFIEYEYPRLMKRAESNKSLKARIDKLHRIMDEDPRFDDATDIERKGYTLYVIAKSKKAGIDNEYFGIETVSPEDAPRFTYDANKNFDDIIKLSKEEDDDFDFDKDYDDMVVLGTNKSSPIILDEEETSSQETSKPDGSKGAIISSNDDDEDISLFSNSTSSEEEEYLDDPDEDEDTLSEEEIKQIQNRYKKELVTALKLNRVDDLEGFTVESKPLELKKALAPRPTQLNTYTWPLIHTGVAVEMTPFRNDEIIVFNPETTKYDTVQGLTSVFEVLYKHIVNPNKPDFETWLRQVSDYDIDSLIFAGFAATFHDTNYVTYECRNKYLGKTCMNMFLQKRDIMDMVSFPNEETKQRFNDILKKSTVMKQTYTTSPKRISKDYAIGFTTQSIYSNLFEPASLSQSFSDKYSTIVNIMPFIDKVYRIDNINKKLIPIKFGVVPNSLSKTVERKVRALNGIFKTFTSDERAIAIGETLKMTNESNKWRITYYIPEAECPVCKSKIERREMSPLNILFIRAQLPTAAAYIQE